jgi:hypothetical protein
MIAEPSLDSFQSLLARAPGELTHAAPTDDSPGKIPLYEYTWGHTTLQALKADRGLTFLQCLFPHERLIGSVRDITAYFGQEMMQHLEFIRFAGSLTTSGLPVVRYSTEARINEMIAAHEAAGVMVANPHVYTLEDGSRHKRADADQLGFKHEVDPMGLLNPGKMRSFVPHTSAVPQ